MKLNKLLNRQLNKLLPEEFRDREWLQPLLQAVSDSYNAYERDNELSARAFTLSEEEYIGINEQLKSEIAVKKLSISSLKEAIGEIDEGTFDAESDDLLDIATYLKSQIRKRREAEEKLAIAADWFSSLVLNLHTGVLLEDHTRHIVLTNQFFCNMFGIGASPEQLTGSDCSGTALQNKHLFKKQEEFVNRIGELIAGKKMSLNEELELADGRFFERDYIPIVKDNQHRGHLWKYRDISTRKTAEAKLKASEELWQFALEGAGDGVWEYDFQTRSAYFSRQYKNMLGYTDDEFANDPQEWLSRIHPEDMPLIMETDRDYFDGRITSHRREYRIRHKNGQYLWILDRGMIISYTADGKPLKIVGTHTDITERKLSEQALEINEEKYRNIIANMNLGLLEVDNEGIIQFANQSFCKLSGYEPDEINGRDAARLFATDENLEILNAKTRLRKTGVSDAYEVAVKNKKGELKWWLISAAPRYDDTGELVGSIGIHLDITEQKQLQLELNEAREAAEHSAKAKEMFLANMSHEIRTPMNAILGMSRQLSQTELNSQQHLFLGTINTAAEYLLVIINDILDISKIEAGKLSLEHIGFRPEEIIRHCIQVMQHRADEKGLQLTMKTDKDIYPVLVGDPYRLNQVLLNLISNAIKFTGKGSVAVSCTLLEARQDQQVLRFSVKDTGIGMDESFLTGIFKKFIQEDPTTARKHGGTGLGMSISKQLVELMNGTIEVKSQKEAGTEVILTLPFTRGSIADLQETARETPDSSILKGKKILLVEDNELNRLLANVILNKYQVHTSEARNGEEAIQSIKTVQLDLILMDMQMPVMDGLEATKIIRKSGNNIPIIALTANAIKGESDQCKAAGMDDYISKPFEEEELIAVIARWLNSKNNTANPMAGNAAAPLYDLGKLRKISPDPLFITKMVALFIEKVPAAVEEIIAAADRNDSAVVKAIAHRIKPSIDSMGIVSAYREIKAIETADENSFSGVPLYQHIIRLQEIIKEVISQLNADHENQNPYTNEA